MASPKNSSDAILFRYRCPDEIRNPSGLPFATGYEGRNIYKEKGFGFHNFVVFLIIITHIKNQEPNLIACFW